MAIAIVTRRQQQRNADRQSQLQNAIADHQATLPHHHHGRAGERREGKYAGLQRGKGHAEDGEGRKDMLLFMFLIAEVVFAMVLIEDVLALLMIIEDSFHPYRGMHSNYNQNASQQ